LPPFSSISRLKRAAASSEKRSDAFIAFYTFSSVGMVAGSDRFGQARRTGAGDVFRKTRIDGLPEKPQATVAGQFMLSEYLNKE
jgi:hypothetical protein